MLLLWRYLLTIELIPYSIGIILSFLSTIFLSTGLLPAFAILYTLGNIISLIGTGFLVGFSTQMKKMYGIMRRLML
jgi:hypothetical protein